MSTDRIYYLLQRLFQQQCTQEEKEELALWIDSVHNNEEWKLRLGKIWNSYAPDEKIDPFKADAILKEVIAGAKEETRQTKIIKPFYKKWAVAAAVVLLTAASFVYLLKRPSTTDSTLASERISNQVKDITPGGNKAILTLANGSKIILDSAQNGSLALQGNTKVIKLGSGQLAYSEQEAGGKQAGTEERARYNTLHTPRGGQYQITLPDGSSVWLNAASSLRFPTAFTGRERGVEVSGEAYFEVAENVLKPFIVHIVSSDGRPEGTVQVLGTHFNINAYSDESAVRTTLLEGAVKIIQSSPAGSEMILSPGQQAVMPDNGSIRVIKDVNMNEAVAWKNGLFDFEGNDIQSVMRQISRWYDVEVRYENVPSVHFMGTISRNVQVSEVLKMLEMTGAVHFRIEKKRITVLP